MKIRLFLGALFFCVWSSHAQLYNNPDGSPGQYLNLTPNSPQATELVRHGNVPVNLSTGQLNYSVPLYTISANGFSWPINLSYNYSGLKAEERPSASGLGWSLISGGVVTREVRGLPDEHPKGYYSATSRHIVDDYVNNGNMSWYTVKNIKEGLHDVEPDKYNVNAGGLSFSFKVKKTSSGTYEAVPLTSVNYKIDFSFSEIRVIDDNGIEYVFNQKEEHKPLNLPSNIYVPDWSDSWTVSWFLSEIILKDYDEVNLKNASHNKIQFEYQTHEYRSRSFFASSYLNSNEIVLTDGTILLPQQSYNDGYSETDIRQPALKRIVFGQGEVVFGLNPTNGYPHYQSAQVKNMANESILNYNFNYGGTRRLLESISKNGESYYSFDYYNTENIIGFSDNNTTVITAQDSWGYYNGQTDNEYVINNPQSSYRANKHPYFDYTVAGALKTITYPSKGTTTIKYEQNKVKKAFTDVNVVAPEMQHKYRLQAGNINTYNAEKTETKTVTLNHHAFAIIEINEKTFNTGDKIAASFKRIDGPNCINSCSSPYVIGDFENQAVKSREFCNEQVFPSICPYYNPDFYFNYGGDAGQVDENGIAYYTKTTSTQGVVKIPAGTYEMKVLVKGNAEVDINFYFTEIKSDYLNVNSGGIRVSETIDSDGRGLAPDDITVYDYNDESGLSRGMKFHQEYQFTYLPARHHYLIGQLSASCPYAEYNTKRLTYHTMNPVNTNSGLPIFYPEVKVYKNPKVYYNPQASDYACMDLDTETNEDGTNIYTLLFEDDEMLGKIIFPEFGYTIKRFKTPEVFAGALSYPFVPVGSEKTGNVLLENSIYGIEEFKNDSYLGAKTINEYMILNLSSNTINQIPTGIKVSDKIHITGSCEMVLEDSDLEDVYYMEIYREHDVSFLPTTSTSTNYSTTGEVLQTVVSQTVYNDKHYVDYTLATDSNGAEIKTQHTYPFSDDAPYNATLLIDKNKLANPIQTTGYKNNVVIGSQKTTYGNAHANYPYVHKVYIAKEDKNLNNDLSDDFREVVEYLGYDKAGNPTEIEQKDGTRVVYLWGYNYTHPVAKIEHATLADVLAVVSGQSGEGLSISLDYDSLQTAGHDTLIEVCNTLRTSLPNTMVTSFTYKPLVGMISQTDPRGRTSTYEYDNQNRLKLIKDHEGNVLEQNEYHFRTE